MCILVQEENWHTSSGWVLLFFFSSLFCDRPVDVEGYFLLEVYEHVGCPHLARYGENKNKGLETYFTPTNLERVQSGIKKIMW